MLRFVEFEDGEDENGKPITRFAFFDTVPELFVTIAGEQSWTGLNELREAWGADRRLNKYPWVRLLDHVEAWERRRIGEKDGMGGGK